MGVRGLLKLLRQTVPPESIDLDAEATGRRAETAPLTLLVDFYAFAFWIFRRCFVDPARANCQSNIWASRDYGSVVSLTRGLAVGLLKRGVQLEVVIDGAKGAGGPGELEAKLPEWRARQSQRMREVTHFKHWLAGVGPPPTPDAEPVPMLFTEAVKVGLQDAGVHAVLAEGEADGVLGRALLKRQESSGESQTAILGNDTDFVIMRGGRFVHLDNLDPQNAVLPQLMERATAKMEPDMSKHEATSAFRVLVWTRAGLARRLGVEEEVLPLAACLCGNDHSRALLERCRGRGLSKKDLPDSFDAIAQLLQDECSGRHGAVSIDLLLEVALDLLRPVLHDSEEQYARQVLQEGAVFYELPPEDHWPDEQHLALVRSEVHKAFLPAWALPLATQGIYFISPPLQDPALGSPSIIPCLRWLRWCALGIMAPQAPGDHAVVQVRVLGPSDRATFDDSLCHQPRLGRLPQVRRLSMAQQREAWEDFARAAARSMASSKTQTAAPQPMQEAGQRLRAMLDGDAGRAAAEHGPPREFLDMLLLLSLHLIAACGCCISLSEVEFDALALMAYALLLSPESVEDYCSHHGGQGHTKSMPSFRSVCLAEWFQAVVSSTLSLAQVLGAAPAQLPSPEKVFHGPLFAKAFMKLSTRQQGSRVGARMGRMGPRGSVDSQDAQAETPATSAVSRESACSAQRPGAGTRMGRKGVRHWVPRATSSGGSCISSSNDKGADGLLILHADPGFQSWKKEALRGIVAQFSQARHQEHDVQSRQAGEGIEEAAVSQRKGHESTQLPIEEKKEELCQALRHHRVVCVQGETGSGKSTQVPQYVLALFEDARVVVTQPRRVAAISLARRVAFERRESVGQTVGYNIGGDRQAGARLNFQTTGFLLRALCSDVRRLGRLTHVIFDEVHERSADADMLSLVVRKLLQQFPDVRLVIMSATLQGELFRTYFRELQPEGAEVPAVTVGGRCFPVQHVYLDELPAFSKNRHHELSHEAMCSLNSALKQFTRGKMKQSGPNRQVLLEYAKTCAPLIIELVYLLAESGCTVLVFLPGLMEITALYEEARFALEAEDGKSDGMAMADPQGGQLAPRKRKPATVRKYRVFAMHSQIPMEEQQAAFKHPEAGVAHCVFASNVAESSLTLPSVAAVIDLGLHRRLAYDRRRRMTYLAMEWESRASAKQRSGRTGRTRNGTAVRLFPQSFLDTLPQFDPPEIAAAPLPRLYLTAKKLGSDLAAAGALADGGLPQLPINASDVLAELVDPPDLATVEEVREELACSGALEAPDEEAPMTGLARVCLGLPFELNLCRLLWLGVHWGHAADAVILACSIAVQDPFSMPSLLTTSNITELGLKLRRSNRSRRYFDGGTFSEPLAVRRLFLLFWRTLPARKGEEERIAGRRAWMRHAHKMADKHAVIPRRLTELCNQVYEVAARLALLCDEDSLAQRQLNALLRGLRPAAAASLRGSASQHEGEEAMFDDSPDWGSEEEDEEEAKEDEAEGMEEEESQEAGAPHAQRRAAIAARELPPWLFERDRDALRALLAAAFSHHLLTETPRNQAASSPSPDKYKDIGADLSRSFLLDLKDLSLGRQHQIGDLLSRLTGGCQWENVGTVKGKACLQIQETQVDQAEAATATRKRDARRRGKEGTPAAVELSDHESTEDLPSDVHGDIHVLHQISRGRKTFTFDVEAGDVKASGQTDSEGSSDSEQIRGPARPTPQRVTWTLNKPVHPCQLFWSWNGAIGEESAGKGSAGSIMAIPRVESHLGFLCDVRRSIARSHWIGCCSHIQGTAEGRLAFVSGMTLLKPEQVKLLLLTIDAKQAGLTFGYVWSEEDGRAIVALKLFGKEVPCRLSRAEVELLDELRRDLRDGLLQKGPLRESARKDLLTQYRQPRDGPLGSLFYQIQTWHAAAPADPAATGLQAMAQLLSPQFFDPVPEQRPSRRAITKKTSKRRPFVMPTKLL